MSSLQKKAAQIVFPRLGSNMPPPVRVHEDFERFRLLHEKYQFGGLVLFNGHQTETPQALTALQRLSDTPMLVASDIERGAGQQIEGMTRFPHAMACGKAGKEAVASFARITAEEAMAAGIHIAFAPVADVNSNPKNPIIGIRAFGSDPEEVKQHVITYIETCRKTGLLTTAKHFPGHGDTATDSHAELPVVSKKWEDISCIEIPPFKAAIETGAELVMTAHVAFPALDSSNKAATLSAPILSDLLRNQLGFNGAIISDSLIMKAIQPQDGDMAKYAAALLNAGLDILLDPLDPEAMVAGIVQAVKEGLVSETRLEQALQHVQSLKKKLTDRFGPDFFTNITPLSSSQLLSNRIRAKEIAAQAIERSQYNNAFSLISTQQKSSKKLAVFVTPYKTRLDDEHAPIKELLINACDGLIYEAVDATTPEPELDRISKSTSFVDEVLVLIVSKPAAWHAYGLPDHLFSFVSDLLKTTRATLVSLGDPHILIQYPQANCKICTYSDVPASQQALVDYLL